MADADLSPKERAIRALGKRCRPLEPWIEIIRGLADLRTSDPDAFAAVLIECGMEGHAVLRGRVVELTFDRHEVNGPFTRDVYGTPWVRPSEQHTEADS